MTEMLALWALEFLTFLLATLNIRACAKGRVGWTLLTDALIAAVGFVLVKRVVEAESPLEMLAYVAGATSGSWLGMAVTRRWHDVE